MSLPRAVLEWLIFGGTGERRFTQDSPVLPDVWIRFGQTPEKPLELLLTPHRRSTPGGVSIELRKRLKDFRHGRNHNIAYSQSSVAVKLSFDELICVVLPMTSWWQKGACQQGVEILQKKQEAGTLVDDLVMALKEPDR